MLLPSSCCVDEREEDSRREKGRREKGRVVSERRRRRTTKRKTYFPFYFGFESHPLLALPYLLRLLFRREKIVFNCGYDIVIGSEKDHEDDPGIKTDPQKRLKAYI